MKKLTAFSILAYLFFVINSNAIWIIVINAKVRPNGKYRIWIIIPKDFQRGFLSLLILESLIIALENGDRRNLECWISPNPIGAPITEITNIPPKINENREDKKPKKGKCHNILANVLIL